MTQFEIYTSGKVCGLRYRFHAAGDQIPMHQHVYRELEHNVIVTRGSILLILNGMKTEHRAGEILDFDSRIDHQIVALEDGTETLNLFLQGEPQGYDALPDTDRCGWLDGGRVDLSKIRT